MPQKMVYLASLKKVQIGILNQSPAENKLSFSAIFREQNSLFWWKTELELELVVEDL
jgi:hypothetical protein